MDKSTFDRLYQDIKYGRLEPVAEYLDDGNDVDSLTHNGGWSLLMCAAFKGNSRILTLLLDRGADIEIIDVTGSTALVMAAAKARTKCVKILLSRGASVNVRPLNRSLMQYMEIAQCPSAEVNALLVLAGAI